MPSCATSNVKHSTTCESHRSFEMRRPIPVFGKTRFLALLRRQCIRRPFQQSPEHRGRYGKRAFHDRMHLLMISTRSSSIPQFIHRCNVDECHGSECGFDQKLSELLFSLSLSVPRPIEVPADQVAGYHLPINFVPHSLIQKRREIGFRKDSRYVRKASFAGTLRR